MGVKVGKVDRNTFTFEAIDINLDYLKSDTLGKRGASLRGGSIMILGPLLARFGVGYIPQPGGGDKLAVVGLIHISSVCKN